GCGRRSLLHLPLSFFGLYTPETRLMLDAYAGFLDRLKNGMLRHPVFLTDRAIQIRAVMV
ncbi:hypothetical protein ACTQ33_11505, partial [Candidatus Avoscillospira sp. LCP25S3_F1]|uniref:hypothetical protein n=1 Tax=Candidatus Avoscillospira sp. LCP25S3_F1 TaxID=3438825 RepID=UPI003F91F3CF